MWKKTAFITIVAVLIVIQLVPVSRTNPPVTGEIRAPEEVMNILKKSCYDCHSNETVWPWYSHVAPVSWLVAHDVDEGREEMNLSEWDSYSEKKKRKKIEEIWEEIEEGEMPLWYYTLIHPDDKLTEQEKRTIKDWSISASAE